MIEACPGGALVLCLIQSSDSIAISPGGAELGKKIDTALSTCYLVTISKFGGAGNGGVSLQRNQQKLFGWSCKIYRLTYKSLATKRPGKYTQKAAQICQGKKTELEFGADVMEPGHGFAID